MGTKIPLDKDVFKEMNNKKAWALGFLTADGSFNKARPYEFTIYSTDYSMLKYFREVFGTKKKIYDHKTESSSNCNAFKRHTRKNLECH